MPSLRQTSGTDVPSSACFRAKTICSSVNRDFFIGTSSVQGSHYHAGILFLNGAGFWGRVNPSMQKYYLKILFSKLLFEKLPHWNKKSNKVLICSAFIKVVRS